MTNRTARSTKRARTGTRPLGPVPPLSGPALRGVPQEVVERRDEVALLRQTTKLPILERVPRAIADYVKSDTFRGELLRAHLASIDRLVTRLEMDRVWKVLTASTVARDVPREFLDTVCQMLQDWREMSSLSKGKAGEKRDQLVVMAEKLAELIQECRPEILLTQSGPIKVEQLVTKAWRSQEPSEPAKNFSALRSNPGLADIAGLRVEHLLIALAAQLRRTRTSYYARNRPTRVEAENASRTFFAITLSEFFHRHMGSAHPAFVARTVRTILDLDPDSSDFTADDARKAYKNHKKSYPITRG